MATNIIAKSNNADKRRAENFRGSPVLEDLLRLNI
jgi:hypothetical protein